MKIFSKGVTAYASENHLLSFVVVAVLVLFTASGCDSDGSAFQDIGDDAVSGSDDDGNDGRAKTLNELVISQCLSLPENTNPVVLDGLAFTDPQPEDKRPENSDTTRACINGS